MEATLFLSAFEEHDSTALAKLTASERAGQLRARLVLQAYLVAVWEAPKQRAVREGRDVDAASPANDPVFSCVAGLLDLAHALVAQAERAQVDVGGLAELRAALEIFRGIGAAETVDLTADIDGLPPSGP